MGRWRTTLVERKIISYLQGSLAMKRVHILYYSVNKEQKNKVMRNPIQCLIILLLIYGCNEKHPNSESSTPFENDIPIAVSNKISLAGSSEPDIIRYLKVQNAISPALSPDGTMVAYRTRLTGEYQIWVTNTDRLSAPKQITFGNSVTFHKWAPDNSGILYGTDKEGNEKEGFYFISSDGLKEKVLLPASDAYRFFGDFNKDGSLFTYATTERNGVDFDIHVYDLRNGTDKKVYLGKLGYYPVSFSPDGQRIIISEQMGEDANNLYLLNLSDTTLSQINKPNDYSFFGDIQWKTDGSAFFMRTNLDEDFTGIALYTLENKTLEYELKKDHDIEQVLLTNNDTMLHWVSNEEGYSKHGIIDLTNGRQVASPAWPKGTLSLTASAGGEKIMAYINSPNIPGDLWSWAPSSKEVVQVTISNHAGLDMDSMVLPKAHSFSARDGLTIHGLLYAPQNLSQKTPVIIQVHGGPTSQARPGFGALTQYLVAKGFAVFDLNYRGSTGYGKTYARENNLRKRENELYDLEDAVKYLTENNIGNSKKIAIMGGSYGGYLTMAAMTRLPEVFTCGVAFVGVSNWVTALESASPELKAGDRLEYGDIDNPEDSVFFESISPIKYIDQVQSPVMVLHGANDPRDPVTESDRFVEGIRKNGGEVAYLRFPDEGHGIRKMNNRITAYVRVAEFLERNLN